MFKNIQSLIRSRSPKKIVLAFAAAFVATVLMVLVPNANANAGTFVYGTSSNYFADLGGYGGAIRSTVTCADGQFVSAIRIKHDNVDYITHMRFWCETPVANTATWNTASETSQYILNSGSEAAGTFSDMGCSTSQFLSGLRAVNNGFIDDLGIECKNILSQATSTAGPNYGQGTVNDTYSCPTGMFVTGFRAYTGGGVDGIADVVCRSLQYQLATPTISSVTDNGASLTVALGNQDAISGANYQVKVYDAGTNALLATSAFFTTSSVSVSDPSFYCGRSYKVTAQATGINGGNGTFEIQSPIVNSTPAADTGCNPSSLTISTGADSNVRWNATTGTFDAITKGAAMVLNNETLRARLQTGASGTNVTITTTDWVNMTGGVAATQPARSAKPHNARASKAPVQDHHGPMAFKRPHSHAPAAIISTVKAMKGQGLAANKAGSNKANRTSAVMTLCLSMRSPEKKAAKGAAIQAVASHGIVCSLRPP